MTDWNGFKGRAKRIEDIDLPRIGHMIGVGEDKIHAVLDVESAGRGFDKHGRPKMLFEPHIFWRELGPGAKREKAAKSGLAYAKWKPGAYPSDSYPRLEKAIAIDETSALRSCSWGLGQVMGFNHNLAGFDTPQAMVLAMMDDEDKHLEAMISFIKSNKLDDDLRRGDWHGFARGYNGAGYARHGYHTRLAKAYAKWQRLPDTPWSPDMVEEEWEADDTPMFDNEPVAEPADQIPAPKPTQPGPDTSPSGEEWGMGGPPERPAPETAIEDGGEPEKPEASSAKGGAVAVLIFIAIVVAFVLKAIGVF